MVRLPFSAFQYNLEVLFQCIVVQPQLQVWSNKSFAFIFIIIITIIVIVIVTVIVIVIVIVIVTVIVCYCSLFHLYASFVKQ